MRSLSLVAATMLAFTIFSTTASTITQPNTPLILILNSETMYPRGGLIIGGQAQPNVNLLINIRFSNNSITQTLEATSDGDGHFKVELLNVTPLEPGVYTVEATTKSTKTCTKFMVLDESTQLCDELERTVKRTRSESEALYKMLEPLTLLATEMNASIQEGNQLYEKAHILRSEGDEKSALEAYRASLRAYGEALHTSELMSSSKPPSAEALLIMELLEKIRRVNDTVNDLNSQTNQRVYPLDSAKDLIAQAEKQLSEDDYNNLQWTLEKLVATMCEVNAETEMISASTTLSQRLSNYKALYEGVLGLEKMLNAKLSSPPHPYPILFDYILKLKDTFKIMEWIEAVSSGKPYTPPAPVVKPINEERIKDLDAEITESETTLRTLAESEHNSTVLATIYKAWDLIKQARLSMLSTDVDYAETLFLEAKTIMGSLK